MRTVLLSTFRSGGARLLAAGIAIAISVGFVVTTLAAMDSFQSGMRSQLAGEYDRVGAVVDTSGLDDDEVHRALTAVQESGAAGAADPRSSAFLQLQTDGGRYSAQARNLPSPDLRAEELAGTLARGSVGDRARRGRGGEPRPARGRLPGHPGVRP